MSDISQKELKAILSYDIETGLFTWLPRSQDEFPSYRAWCVWTGCYCGKVAGCDRGQGYVAINIDRQILLAHRLAWLYVHGVMPPDKIDHINGVRNDNRIENLRSCTQAQNKQNMRKAKVNNSTGYLGVSTSGSGRFRAAINRIHIGCFDTAIEAHEAYLKEKRKLHEFCTL